jgi:hypothetical protein
MSERRKLEREWQRTTYAGRTVYPKDMIIQLGKLVENCPHTKTHWIQEIDQEGNFKDHLFKRCYLCGFNIDELETEPEFIEHLLDVFDKSCEEKKLLVTPIEEGSHVEEAKPNE